MEIDQKENETHDVVWVNHNEVLNYLFDDKSDTLFWNRMIGEESIYTGDGILINSEEFDGLDSKTARGKMTKWLEERKLGEKKINYKLKDWVFSRQRYWGEPIPLIHCGYCGVVAVPEKDLPVKLPKVKFYEPTDTGESPLAKMDKWTNVKCPKCGGKGKRETNTMPQWAGSSWYYLRYIDPKNKKALVDKKKEKYWSPVDMYVGGTEHATRHLIYARFWHKFLYDIGIVGEKEPFASLKNQGLIMGNDGRKMSKRWGNVVNPDDVVSQFGADTLRVYEMFMGPFDQPISWSADNMIGSRRFLERVYSLSLKLKNKKSNLKTENPKLERLIHQTIKKVTEDIENFRFNTAISALMILLNEMEKDENKPSSFSYKSFIKLLSPFAPHLAEEIWQNILGEKKSIHLEEWPKFDESKIEPDETTVVVQINGKVRGSFSAGKDKNQEEIQSIALSLPEIKKYVGENEIKKILFVKNKIISIVI
ncbi:MAG: class I tRNA ligase family protein [Patescibacteria group bacterium]|nr:class I tRNA ligase family protein [Patescibacteria group bacterium]MDE2218172.1 class I tRNA ligase family protein [Patescibacteria group bacterium]